MTAFLILLPKIFSWIGMAVTAASAIVHATPSQKDDAVLGKVVKVLDVISVVSPKPTK